MLNLDIKVKVSKTPDFPYKLIGVNECLHCGAKGTLQKINIFGNASPQEIYPLDKIKCSACGYEYSIEWKQDISGKMIPVPVNKSMKQEVLNTLNYFTIKRNGTPEIPNVQK